MTIPICDDCGEELTDYLDVEAGRCMDCVMDSEDDDRQDREDE